jgi:hypothetical protein
MFILSRLGQTALAMAGAVCWRLLYFAWRSLLARIDRWTDPPIMRQRINEGSDRYLERRNPHEGDSKLDEIFGRDDDEPSD